MEKISTINPEYQPCIVSLMAPICKTIPLAPIHSFTTQTNSTFNVSRIVDLKSFDIHGMSSLNAPYKFLPSIKIILGTHHFFLSTFYFHFHRTLFCGLAGACVNPRSIFSNSYFVHSFVCPITHLFLDGFQPNLVQHFPHVYSTCHTSA